MDTGRLKDMLANVGDDMPVLVKTADGWKRASIAYEDALCTGRMNTLTPRKQPKRSVQG